MDMDTDAGLQVALVGAVAVGAAAVVIAAAVSGGLRWKERAWVGDVERADGDDDADATLMTYEQAAARSLPAAAATGARAEGEEDVCVICQSEYAGAGELVRMVQCGHFFHVGCIDRWLRKRPRCPICRRGLPLPPHPEPGCPPMPPRTSRPAAAAAVVG
ncbi:E3 ubiquitin-protein ligase EL5-like [Oryza brachyantha]|uniref:E3 ubiquitin-protein ligase EL5-like n=1 Tax=Oryza brachyantha TaxID=4533 RepID=UPI001AD9DC3A|nr:E3 ubiquitin-protein ligase EL5-like [Oryza brachyantha]